MDNDANIINVEFSKSVINSQASLTYDQAQQILDNHTSGEPVSLSIRMLNHFAKILKRRRIDAGALTLASPEVRFKFDDDSSNPTDLTLYNLKETNSMVEEWMLLANITVSKKILKHFPTLSLLRRHQPPSSEQFLPLLKLATAAGFGLDISTSKSLADSLDNAVRREDPQFNKLLRILTTRCMTPAQYFCSGEISKDQWHHYGLATQIYSHFTSPIRRYADIIVHRLLAAALGLEILPRAYNDRLKLQELATHMNRKHRTAQQAQRASVNLYSIQFFKSNTKSEQSYIISLDLEKITVMVPKFGMESSIPLDSLREMYSADSYQVSSEEMSVHFISNSRKAKCLRIFDQLLIEIKVVEEPGTLGRIALQPIP
jgi:exosome complex exonuclease DIS3/RRP44